MLTADPRRYGARASSRVRGPESPSALVTAVVAPADLDAVLDALEREGAGAVHVSEAQGRLPEGSHGTEIYKGAVYRVRLVPRVRLEVVVAAAAAPALMEAVSAAAREPLAEGDLFAVDVRARGKSSALGEQESDVAGPGRTAGDDALPP